MRMAGERSAVLLQNGGHPIQATELADSTSVLWLGYAPRLALYGTFGVLAAALVLVILSAYHVTFSGDQDACCVSEWLINYDGGFVRRGLGGTIILSLAHLTAVNPRVVVFAILSGCYAILFASLAVLVSRVRRLDYFDLLLAISPFAALFPVFHRVAGQRKEILLLALAGLAGTTGLGRLDSAMKYVCWSFILTAVVAIHDGSIFFLPLFLIYLRVVTPPRHPMGHRAWWLLLPPGGVFLLSYMVSNHADTTAICTTMNTAAQGSWCGPGSAVEWLNASAIDGVRSVIRGYTSSATVFVARTLLPGLAGLMCIAIGLHKDGAVLRPLVHDLPLQRLFPWLSGMAIGVLFSVADDGNRWFYITTLLLTLIHFSARQDAPLRSEG